MSKPEIPAISGEWWQVAGNPDLGELTEPHQQPVDFSLWQAADGNFQILSCIRHTKEPGHTRLLHGWQGERLTDTNWTPRGIVMQADPSLGEQAGGLQAPHIFRVGDTYQMLYGDWRRICVATSTDGIHFTRELQPDGTPGVFGEGPEDNARDPMAIWSDGLWYVYYCAHPNRQGRVYCRTSPDLRHYSNPVVVARGGHGGDGPYSAECPHVVRRGDWFYLFRTEKYAPEPITHVYASPNPLYFGVDGDERGYVTTLSIAAPEIWTDAGGADYVASLLPTLDGIRIARLTWTNT